MSLQMPTGAKASQRRDVILDAVLDFTVFFRGEIRYNSCSYSHLLGTFLMNYIRNRLLCLEKELNILCRYKRVSL
jgi:hypothetical protein